MRTEIEFLKDPNTGEQQVLEVIKSLSTQREDKGKLQLYAFIIRGLSFLKRHGLSQALVEFFTTQSEEGNPYTIKLVKVLRNHVPLVEFRVNWKGTGAFRAIFFEYERSGVKILCFVKAVIKQTTYDTHFERMAIESEAVHADFILNPEKYINLTGVEDNG